MRAEASRELDATREAVWSFIAEPLHLADWWPGISAVRPDRRGFALGARWEIVGGPRPSFFRSSAASSMLVVKAIEPYERFSWTFLQQRLDVEVRLRVLSPDRTLATVAVQGPWRPEALGRPRALPRHAL